MKYFTQYELDYYRIPEDCYKLYDVYLARTTKIIFGVALEKVIPRYDKFTGNIAKYNLESYKFCINSDEKNNNLQEYEIIDEYKVRYSYTKEEVEKRNGKIVSKTSFPQLKVTEIFYSEIEEGIYTESYFVIEKDEVFCKDFNSRMLFYEDLFVCGVRGVELLLFSGDEMLGYMDIEYNILYAYLEQKEIDRIEAVDGLGLYVYRDYTRE